jgi:PAS domain S-box-containing protein
VSNSTITQHKGTNRIRTLFERTTLGVTHVAPDGRFLMVNPGFCRMLGYDRRELLRKTCEETTHPDDRPREAALLEGILSGQETSYDIEKRYLRRNGTAGWVHETSSAIRDVDGALLHRISLVSINESKRMQDLFQLVFDSACNGMLITDTRRKIVFVNSQAERIFDYRREELLGRPAEILMPELRFKSDDEFCKGFLLHPRASQIGSDPKLYGRRKNGTLAFLEINLIPMDSLEGTWVLISIVDVTERIDPQENDEKFYSVFPDCAADMAIAFPGGHFLDVNAVKLLEASTRCIPGWNPRRQSSETQITDDGSSKSGQPVAQSAGASLHPVSANR